MWAALSVQESCRIQGRSIGARFKSDDIWRDYKWAWVETLSHPENWSFQCEILQPEDG